MDLTATTPISTDVISNMPTIQEQIKKIRQAQIKIFGANREKIEENQDKLFLYNMIKNYSNPFNFQNNQAMSPRNYYGMDLHEHCFNYHLSFPFSAFQTL